MKAEEEGRAAGKDGRRVEFEEGMEGKDIMCKQRRQDSRWVRSCTPVLGGGVRRGGETSINVTEPLTSAAGQDAGREARHASHTSKAVMQQDKELQHTPRRVTPSHTFPLT